MSEVFTATVNGKEVKLKVRKPTVKERQLSQLAHSKAVADAVKAGALLRAKAEQVIKEQGIWGEKEEAEYNLISVQIAEKLAEIKKGGKLSVARSAALEVIELRGKRNSLLTQRSALEGDTAESLGDQARLNFLASVCLVHAESGKAFFKDVDALMADETEVADKAVSLVMREEFGLDPDFEKSLPEYKFLVKQRLVDPEGRLVDKKGNFVDREGNLVILPSKVIEEEVEAVYEDDLSESSTDPEEEVAVEAEVDAIETSPVEEPALAGEPV